MTAHVPADLSRTDRGDSPYERCASNDKILSIHPSLDSWTKLDNQNIPSHIGTVNADTDCFQFLTQESGVLG